TDESLRAALDQGIRKLAGMVGVQGVTGFDENALSLMETNYNERSDMGKGGLNLLLDRSGISSFDTLLDDLNAVHARLAQPEPSAGAAAEAGQETAPGGLAGQVDRTGPAAAVPESGTDTEEQSQPE